MTLPVDWEDNVGMEVDANWLNLVGTTVNQHTTDIAGKANSVHTHSIANVSGLQTALDGKATSAHTHADPDWDDITNKPATFTPATHSHAIADTTGLQAALDGKAAQSHTHTVGNVTGLQTTLDGLQTSIDGKANSSHTHAVADVTGLQTELDGIDTRLDDLESTPPGSADWTEITNKPATFPPSTHSHAISDVTGLQTALDNKAANSHSHAISDVTGLQDEIDSKADAGWVEGIESSVTTHTGLITTLQTDVGTLQTDVGTLQADVTSLDGRVDDLELAGGGGGVAPFRTNVGNGSPGPYDFQHDLDNVDFFAQIMRNAGHIDNAGNGGIVYAPVVPLDGDNARVDTTETWATDQMRVILWPIVGADMTAPATPTLTEVDATASAISVSATAGHASYAWLLDGSEVERTSANTYDYTGLLASTEYDCAVIAFDLYGNPAQSATVPITTDSSGDATPPTAGAWSVQSTDTTSITYQEDTPGSDNVGVVGIDAYNDADDSLIASNISSPWTWTGRTPDTSYSVYFRYRDLAGLFDDSTVVTDSTDPVVAGPVARVAGTGTNDYRTTPNTTPVTAAPAFTVPDNGKQHGAIAWVTVSHSDSNNPPTYDVATCASNNGTAWTYVGAVRCGPFSGQSQGAILMFKKENVNAGAHTLDIDIDKSGYSFTSLMVHVDVYENAGTISAPVTVEQNSSTNVTITVPTVDTDNMAAACFVSTADVTLTNGTERYNNGGSVTGTGDHMHVRDAAGAGANFVFTSSTSTTYAGMGVEINKAA